MAAARAAGLPFCCWVGDDGPRSLADVSTALEARADRLCGCLSLCKDNALITTVAASKVPLEACLSSSVMGPNRKLATFMAHPALALCALRGPVALCVGSSLLSCGGDRAGDQTAEASHPSINSFPN